MHKTINSVVTYELGLSGVENKLSATITEKINGKREITINVDGLKELPMIDEFVSSVERKQTQEEAKDGVKAVGIADKYLDAIEVHMGLLSSLRELITTVIK